MGTPPYFFFFLTEDNSFRFRRADLQANCFALHWQLSTREVSDQWFQKYNITRKKAELKSWGPWTSPTCGGNSVHKNMNRIGEKGLQLAESNRHEDRVYLLLVNQTKLKLLGIYNHNLQRTSEGESLLQICEMHVDWLGSGALAIVKDWSAIPRPGLLLSPRGRLPVILLPSTWAQTFPERLISEIPSGNNNKKRHP